MHKQQKNAISPINFMIFAMLIIILAFIMTGNVQYASKAFNRACTVAEKFADHSEQKTRSAITVKASPARVNINNISIVAQCSNNITVAAHDATVEDSCTIHRIDTITTDTTAQTPSPDTNLDADYL